MPFEKLVVIDARAHMLGRLASVVAKELLSGQKVVLVRCEQINISGSQVRPPWPSALLPRMHAPCSVYWRLDFGPAEEQAIKPVWINGVGNGFARCGHGT